MIEEPGYYFKDDSLSTTLALDNLMLTHGYRHFEWKEISEDKYPKIEYPAEECIQVRGTVKSILLKKPIPDCRVTMVSLKGLFKFYQVTTDSLGQFLFSNLYFNDTIPFSLQAINKKGKRNTEIALDRQSSISPPSNYLPSSYQYIQSNPVNIFANLGELSQEMIDKKWRLSDTILLEDIDIRAAKAKKNEGYVRIYDRADYVFEVAKLDDVYRNIFEMMDGKVAGMELRENAFFIRGNEQPALLLLYGVPINGDFISDLSLRSFDKIEVVKYAPQLGSKGNNGAIFFYLKRGQQQTYISTDALGMKKTTVVGYSVIRQFYSPQYATNLPTEMRNDYRSTLYWNPIVRTDSLGRAAVSFLNGDQTGEVKVVVEGVTADGKLCRGVGRYNVMP